jgi:uncharacterized protein involved in cysteine biosynthesis
MREFLQGAKSYWHSWMLIRRQGMWPLLLLPGLISVCYFPAASFLTVWFGGDLAVYLRDRWFPEFLKPDIYFLLVTLVLAGLGLYLGFVLFRNVVMILYSPILSFLSRKTEENASQMVCPPVNGGIWQGMMRGIGISLASLGLALACFGLCVLLLLIPIVGEVAMFLLPVSQMFLAGHGFVDPLLERRNYDVGKSFRFAWQHRYRVAGCGSVFMLLAAVPLVGWFLAPTLGVVAGTLMGLEILEAARRKESALESST